MDVLNWIESQRNMFTSLSNKVWGFAELGYQETLSAQTLADALEEMGFKVKRGVARIPTAFIGSFSNGAGPVIGFLGEFDALPGLSQEAVPYKKSRVDGAPGHGCGHNLLGVGSLAAAAAVKEMLTRNEVRGTVRYYGCPAEEGGAGKAFMTKAGAFDDVDIILTWHPDAFNATMAVNFLANYRVFFKFHGKAAHAATDPFNGRSALDAVELMNVGVNYLREHMIPDARIHYIITNGGGTAPNVVPAEAASLYSVRAPRTDQLNDLFERVKDIARGAALMTGTEMEFVVNSGMSNMLLNDTINQVLQEKLEQIGAPKFSAEENEFARKIAEYIPAGSLDTIAPTYGLNADMLDELKKAMLHESVLPMFKNEIIQPGSTDVGDVSWAAPTGQIVTACMALGTPGHSWQTAAQGGMGIGHRGMLYAGKVMALAGLEFMQNSARLKQAKDEYKTKRNAVKYVSPIPDGAKPTLNV
jgi:aminobenzoyl-glutamate utilization protein B